MAERLIVGRRWPWLLLAAFQIVIGAFDVATGSWDLGAAAIIYGLGWVMFVQFRRSLAGMNYRAGWYDGRFAMLDSAIESAERGMTPGQWFHGEIERDRVNLQKRAPVDPEEG